MTREKEMAGKEKQRQSETAADELQRIGMACYYRVSASEALTRKTATALGKVLMYQLYQSKV